MIAWQFLAQLMLIFNISQNYRDVPEDWKKPSTISTNGK